MEIKIPTLGDGINSGIIVSILVSPGETVQKDQTVMELETDKAVAPIPVSEAGVVDQILVKAGDSVGVGKVFMTLKGSGDVSQTPAKKTDEQASSSPAPIAITPQAAPASISNVGTYQSGVSQAATSPSIRRFADQFGLDLSRVPGTGLSGRITNADIKTYINFLQVTAFQSKAEPSQAATPAVEVLPDFSKWGAVHYQELTSLRRLIAKNLTGSWTTIPHVTQFEEADITHLMALRAKYKNKFEKEKAKLTLTVFVMKAVVKALKKFPLFNASLDEANNRVVVKDYFHLGIAVDTEAGLIVPVLRDVDKKSMVELSLELSEIAEKARSRKIAVEDLKGASFTISNLGGLGGTHFTPIVNRPEVAILGLGKGKQVPVWEDGKWIPRLTMPLSMSYDHRIIDGADGARFIAVLAHELAAFDEAELKGK